MRTVNRSNSATPDDQKMADIVRYARQVTPPDNWLVQVSNSEKIDRALKIERDRQRKNKRRN